MNRTHTLFPIALIRRCLVEERRVKELEEAIVDMPGKLACVDGIIDENEANEWAAETIGYQRWLSLVNERYVGRKALAEAIERG